ncbi:MAG: hypothetical protein OXT49_10210 [Gammaproteobacteria bacterium]|nr:hypothetical protein [Gammaproteobacteria bacterium]
MDLNSYKQQMLSQLDGYKAKANDLKNLAEDQISGQISEAKRLRNEVEIQIADAREAIEGLAESGMAIGKDTLEDAKGVAEKVLGEVAAKVDELKTKIGS